VGVVLSWSAAAPVLRRKTSLGCSCRRDAVVEEVDCGGSTANGLGRRVGDALLELPEPELYMQGATV
jgi:hypothetical protein